MRRLSWPLCCLVTLALAAGAAADALSPQPGQAAPGTPARARIAKQAPAAATEPPARGPLDRSAPLPGALSPRNANYSIDVALNARTHTLAGRAVVTWRNTSAASTSELRFHLYYNAWKNTRSSWMREGQLAGGGGSDTIKPGDWGWIEVSAVRLLPGDAPPVDVTGRRRYISPDDGNPDDQTVMSVPLPVEVKPGETVSVELVWESKIPRTFARTGVQGNYFFLAQWFPKIGVLEDSGWNCHQFHRGTEFFADYGVYDVRLKVPRGWVLGASGREQARSDTAENTTTYTYHAQDVHDFAWTTSPDFLERTARFEHPRLPAVEMRLLLQPEHSDQADRHFEATRAALKYYGEWFGAYPYGHITVIDPAWRSGSGGMEYPTLFTAGSRWLVSEGVTQPEGVTIHEAGHQFWYAIVGNNEFEDAWMDEGLNTYSTARAIDEHPLFKTNYYSRRYFGGFVPYLFKDITRSRAIDGNGLGGYRFAAKSDAQSTPSWQYFPATGGGLSYSKTALWLHTLERYLGWPTFQKIMSTYFQRWKFRHPKPADFFALVNEVSGRDLTWFFDQVYRSSNAFDYAVDSVRSTSVEGRGMADRNGKVEPIASSDQPGKLRSTVIVRRLGEAVFPIDVLVEFDNGEKVREKWDGLDRWKAFTYERTSRVTFAEVDPDRILLLDLNRTNNSWTAAPKAAYAAHKWMLKWMIWLQDAMLNASFFI
jgi:hypothetical protein